MAKKAANKAYGFTNIYDSNLSNTHIVRPKKKPSKKPIPSEPKPLESQFVTYTRGYKIPGREPNIDTNIIKRRKITIEKLLGHGSTRFGKNVNIVKPRRSLFPPDKQVRSGSKNKNILKRLFDFNGVKNGS